MKNKILIDASTVMDTADGLSNYIIGIIRHLPKESFNYFDYTILINPDLKRPELITYIENNPFTILKEKIRPIGPKRDWDMFWFLKKYEAKFDLIHITSNNYPLSLKKGICTIHDITFKRFFDSPKYSFNLATRYLNLVIGNCLKRATAIIAVSRSTKSELEHWYNVTPAESEKITVIYEGYEHLDYGEKSAEACYKPALSHGYLFYLGSMRKHKNISNLIAGFKHALPQLPAGIQLVASGSERFLSNEDRNLVSQINSSGERIVFTGYLSHACVEQYFRNCDAFILPSLSEGFGIPVLEAFYFGKPILCSDTTSLPEVAGEAAQYFDPVSPESIGAAIINFYQHPELAVALVKKGRERLQLFSWNIAAAETVALYKKVLKTREDICLERLLR